MDAFLPSYSGKDISAAEQFQRLAQLLNGEFVIPMKTVAPKKPRTGLVVGSDGVHWNPLAAGVPRLVWWNGSAWKALNA